MYLRRPYRGLMQNHVLWAWILIRKSLLIFIVIVSSQQFTTRLPECFFKLLKSAGHHLESWQQESAHAIAKRLLVASMACVTVWAIAADNNKEAAELRAFLVKLAGKCGIKRSLRIQRCWQAYGYSSPCLKSWGHTPKRNWTV